METKSSSAWIAAGYELFAHEGLDGIQVERLARILQRNKSGFYHYFGDIEGYHTEILRLHESRVNDFLHQIATLQKLNPDYLHLLINHADTVMFQVQLVRTKTNAMFYQASEAVDQKVNAAVRGLWIEFLGINQNNDLAIRYYYMVRDTFYSRISFKNLNYEFLNNLAHEAKQLVDNVIHRRTIASTS